MANIYDYINGQVTTQMERLEQRLNQNMKHQTQELIGLFIDRFNMSPPPVPTVETPDATPEAFNKRAEKQPEKPTLASSNPTPAAGPPQDRRTNRIQHKLPLETLHFQHKINYLHISSNYFNIIIIIIYEINDKVHAKFFNNKEKIIKIKSNNEKKKLKKC